MIYSFDFLTGFHIYSELYGTIPMGFPEKRKKCGLRQRHLYICNVISRPYFLQCNVGFELREIIKLIKSIN